MVKMSLVVASAATLVAGAAVAAEATFENHLQSAPMVSPAQLYQIDALRTDFGLGYLSDEGKATPDGGDAMKDNTTGTDLFAAGIYNVKSIGLRAGLSVNYGSATTESDEIGATGDMDKVKWSGSRMVVTPQAAMPAGPVVVGLAIDSTQMSAKPEDGDEMKVNYTTLRPGVLFASGEMEAGATWSSKTNIKYDPEKPKDLPAANPAAFTAHGRYATSKELAVGGILRQENWDGIDKDAFKARTSLKGTVEWGAGPLKVEGDLGLNTAYYKNKDVLGSSETIGTYELGAAADYAVNKDTSVGGGFAYEFGSDSANSVKYATNSLGLEVRGNMKF